MRPPPATISSPTTRQQPSLHPILLFLFILSLMITIQPTTASNPATVVITITETAAATATAIQGTPSHDPSYASLTHFKNAILSVTNTYRAAHNASDLIWNDTLTTFAREWAQTCVWEHSDSPYGENLAFGYANASAAVQAWGDEVRMYDFDEPTGFTEETGHFTQLVWRATTEVGCAAFYCGYSSSHSHSSRLGLLRGDHDRGGGDGEEGEETRAQGWYVVCEYVPSGNVVGGNEELGDKAHFKVNVQASSTYSGPYNTPGPPGPSGSGSGDESGAVGSRQGGGCLCFVGVVVLLSTFALAV